jgi:Cof subfamily protein (haloacid dehalogenase superfamily)
MIATDLDGTLLAGKSNLPEGNIIALKRAMEAGVQVVIASGRMIEATLPIARAVGVNAPLSLFNGAMTYDMQKDEILCGHVVPRDTAIAVLRALEERGTYVQAFPGKGYFMEQKNHWTDYYENKIGVIGTAVGMKLSSWLDSDVYKLLCLGSSAELNEIIRDLSPKFPQVTFVKSGETHLEVITQGVDKASGMADISRVTGIAPEEMMAFGDEMNDLPMLLWAGTGYAMENAVPDVRRAVRLTAPKNTDCGVARIINMYLDQGRMGGC